MSVTPEPRAVNPILKQVLELGPTVLFFVLYMRIKEDTFVVFGREYSGFIVASLALIPILLLAMGLLWKLTGKISRMQVFTALMLLVFGGLTAFFNDDRFFKMKTSIVYGFFALLLGIGLLRGQSWLQWIMGEFLPMREEGWMKLTKRLALMFLALAIANELIWRNMAEETWVTLETFAFPVALFVFLWVQIISLRSYLIEDEADK